MYETRDRGRKNDAGVTIGIIHAGNGGFNTLDTALRDLEVGLAVITTETRGIGLIKLYEWTW